MKSGKKLIIYCDGSFKNRKYGWCFIRFLNFNYAPHEKGYGSGEASSSIQAEVKACIKAIANLPDFYDQLWQSVEVIEIRSDLLQLVEYINNRGSPNINGSNQKENTFKHFSELLKIIEQLPCTVRAKKVSKKDLHIRIVDKGARHALRVLPKNELYFHLKIGREQEKTISDRNEKFKFDHQKLSFQSKKAKWPYCDIKDIVHIPVEQVRITEEVHLKASEISFNGSLERIQQSGEIELPIAVREIEEGKYSLVAGISRLCAAKLLEIEVIPALVCNMSHSEFILRVRNNKC